MQPLNRLEVVAGLWMFGGSEEQQRNVVLTLEKSVDQTYGEFCHSGMEIVARDAYPQFVLFVP